MNPIKIVTIPLKLTFHTVVLNLSKILTLFVRRKKNLWVFGSWHGKMYSDNTRYFFEYIDKNHPEIEGVWLANNQEVYEKLMNKGLNVAKFGSFKSLRYLFRAGVVLTSAGVADLGPVRLYGGAFQAELWHGMPITKVFHDKPMFRKNKMLSILYNIKEIASEGKPHMIVSTSKQTQKVISSAFKNKNVAITGQPRYEGMFNKKGQKELLDKVAPKIKKGTKILSYVPTFRNPFTPESFFFSRKDWNEKEMDKVLKENNAIMIIKMHFYGRNASSESQSDRIIFNNDIEIQDLLGVSDVLITDYSSCFIDYLILNRPMIFTPFDIENHIEKRGFYYKYEDVTPGPKAKGFKSLKTEIDKYLKNPKKDSDKREKANKLFNGNFKKNNSETVYKKIIKQIGDS